MPNPFKTRRTRSWFRSTRPAQFSPTATGENREPVSADELKTKITAFHTANPELQVLVAGDQRVGYGKVYQILPILQEAGVSKIGLMSQPESGAQNGKP